MTPLSPMIGAVKAFDDPTRQPGEPWAQRTSEMVHTIIDVDLRRIRETPMEFAELAVICQQLERHYHAERNKYIAAVVRQGGNVEGIARQLLLSRQQIYAIAAETVMP